ncbi:sulfatase [Flammeovirga agarivorans]|uniref:Sulfatase n=1 Tax=Flammeovirga agarivorans TaxID=2726742 RepID=A0A7X8SNM7_9BACT|nr:sulfatase [Flammeovirga agarivorans]NLR93475.1 sulfatase [Flammeovirga agarivorans]
MKYLLLVIPFILSSVNGIAKQDPQKPNIIVFFVDDMGWKDLAIMGSDYHETPNIDALAKEGMTFYNAYSAGPNCAPSRACLMSGQYTPRHGKIAVWNSKRGIEEQMRLEPVPDKGLPLDNYTLAEALRDGGYETGLFGKWHIAGTPALQGFDVDHETDAGEIKFKQTNDPKDIFKLTEEACDFMEENKKNPFFLFLSHHTVHTKWEARQEMIDYFEEKPKGKIHKSAKYAAMVKHTDDSMGMIMKKLKDLKLDKNTIVIFTSDNGAIGKVKQTPLRGSKGMLYEGGIKVPFIVWNPTNIKAGSKSYERTINVDLYPTFLDYANITPKEDKILDGASLKGLTFGKTKELPSRSLFYHYPNYLNGSKARGARDEYFRNRPVTVVIKDNWKLLFFHEEYVLDGGIAKIDKNNMVELYNLKDDPSESKDVALDNKEIRDALVNELQEWMKATDAKLAMKPTPENYRPVYKRNKSH